MALSLLLQDIKAEFDLSDTQLGLLSGIAFAMFYSVLGIPLARWADRGNRVLLISITTALWSAAVALCGAAGSFVQLLFIRIGAAIGEAGCMPPAQSLIADYFNRAERPKAIAIYMLGAPLSAIIGFFLAGWLNQSYGWRATFVLLGFPGLALAVLSSLTLREPRREKQMVASIAVLVPPSSMREVAVTLWGSTTFRHLLLCFSVISFFGQGIGTWQPVYFIRSFSFSTAELGMWFALIYGVGGLLGTYCGGALASRFAARNETLQLKVTALMYGGFGALSVLTYLSPNPFWAFGLIGFSFIGLSMIIGPLFATIQTLVPSTMRAQSIALIYLSANLIGMGLGPLAAGALSDALHPFVGAESIRYSLLALSPGYLWAAWHAWRASKSVVEDLRMIPVEA